MAEITWAEALKEAEDSAARDPNLWAQCFAESDGDEGKARALYVKRRMNAADADPAPAPAPAKAPATAPTSGWCPNCISECKLDASTCQMCGADFMTGGWKPTPYKPTPRPSPDPKETKAKSGGRIWKWILGVPVGGFVLMMVIGSCAGNSPEGKERASSRDAISYCWKEQSKKSLSDSTARFVASTCEKMESDFKAKWGRSP
ncbi:hypothetical protein KW830_08325 [Comamonas sp. CMM03]|uniref:hypothetical protein n=1 Tax=Comamonas sp. CMM03 TaxID=2854781 RepID=UPI001C494520|nr:hypothetical protein [Comamonas sp. CMM03]MBV7418461.1 hypothetical protein [Comamonas sp. CMM03]